MKCKEKGCRPESSLNVLMNVVQQALAQEYDTVNLDFYNDWLNGSLYLPLWFWKKTKKKKYLFGLFSKKAVNQFCSCSKHFSKLRVTQCCSLSYTKDFKYTDGDRDKKYHFHYPSRVITTYFGIIKEFVNKAGLNIYYYAPGIPNDPSYRNKNEAVNYVRLYSTDIILLGSLNSCDLDNYPNVFSNLPTTTANIPFIASIIQTTDSETTTTEGTGEDKGLIEITGMDWLHDPNKSAPKYGNGLLMDLACNAVYTKPKTCVNLERMCELGVTLDTYEEKIVPKNGVLTHNIIVADGMITRYEIMDNETRAMFASLNNNGFKEKVYNPNTGYNTYKLRYVYPNDFDGRLESLAPNYTSMMEFKTYDIKDPSYVEYRFGPHGEYHFYNSGAKVDFPLFNNSFYFYFGINEGSTAIDKFNNKFYATCFKNSKFPFTLNIETEASRWCPKKDSDYGTFKVKFKTIKMPYSYTLTNEFNEEILSENGVFAEELNFGYKVTPGGGSYILENDNLVKNGIFSEFTTGKELNDKHVTNGTYKIAITDANANKLSQNIILEQVPITLVYETNNLGNKYYNDELSKKEDFCNENEFFGELIIKGAIIDGIEYKIKDENSIIENNSKLINDFNLILIDEKTKDEQEINIKIEVNYIENSDEKEDFNECTCQNVNKKPSYHYKNNKLIFNIWKPLTFTVTATQICNGKLNDNFSIITDSIKNGKAFEIYVNEVPMRFILGKNEDWKNYNDNFYKNNGKDGYNGWFKLHDENAYKFPEVNINRKQIWEEYVEYVSEEPKFPNNIIENENEEMVLSYDSILNIIEYKFKNIFTMCKNFYINGDNDYSMIITHSGGKAPILYRLNYVNYDSIDGDENMDNKILIKADSDGQVSCNYSYPNIVSYNYTYVSPVSGIPTPMYENSNGMNFNQLIHDYGNIGNYVAAFTKNGGCEEGKLNKDVKYQQIPFKANPMLLNYGIDCENSRDEHDYFSPTVYNGDKEHKAYFRSEFLDRRFDYEFLIITPYSNGDVEFICESDKTSNRNWKTGRLSGTTFNGVEMIYDKKTHEIIGKDLEYYYTQIENNEQDTEVKRENDYNITYNENNTDKRFFSTIIKCDYEKYDINDYYWATNRIPELGKLNDNGLFIEEHKNDSSSYNGIFNRDNYPMKRLLDINDIKKCNRFTFTQSSCSYNVELDYEVSVTDDDRISGIIEASDETEFSIDCKNMITPVFSSLEDLARQRSYNVRYSLGRSNICKSSNLKLNCKLKQDTVNDTHLCYTEFPNLFKIKGHGVNENLILDIKNNTYSLTDLKKKLYNSVNNIFNKGYNIGEFSPVNSTISPEITYKRDTVPYGVFKHIETGNYWVESEDNNKILFDDDTSVKNITYYIEKEINNLDVIGTFIKRNYINNSDDNLTKSISTIQFTSIYDVRQFELRLSCASIIEQSNNSGTESGGTEGGEQQETVKTQKTVFTVTTEIDNTGYNQQFFSKIDDNNYDTSSLSAMFSIFTFFHGIRVAKNVTITNRFEQSTDNKTSNKLHIDFEVLWDGELKDIFLKDIIDIDFGNRCMLLIKMPNSLIYSIEFKLDDLYSSNVQECQ